MTIIRSEGVNQAAPRSRTCSQWTTFQWTTSLYALLQDVYFAEKEQLRLLPMLLGWAEHLGEDEVVDLLGESLEEERHADELLSSIAEGGVNASASERPASVKV